MAFCPLLPSLTLKPLHHQHVRFLTTPLPYRATCPRLTTSTPWKILPKQPNKPNWMKLSMQSCLCHLTTSSLNTGTVMFPINSQPLAQCLLIHIKVPINSCRINKQNVSIWSWPSKNRLVHSLYLKNFTIGSLHRTEVSPLIIFSVAPYLSMAHQSGPPHGCFLFITKIRQSLRFSPQNSPAKALGKLVPMHLIQWKNI